MCSRENQVRFALFLESHSVPLLHLKIRGSFEDRLSDHFEWLRQLIATFVFRLSINVRFLALGCSIVISSTSGELTTHLQLPRRSEKTASKTLYHKSQPCLLSRAKQGKQVLPNRNTHYTV